VVAFAAAILATPIQLIADVASSSGFVQAPFSVNVSNLASTLDATDAQGIRKFPGGDLFLLDFLAVKRRNRGPQVLEFDVRALVPAPPTTQLLLPIQNLDQPGGPPGSIDVFTFIGNGVFQASDFDGDCFATIPTSNVNRETLLLDFTAAVQ
jgi:hypothetical protein